MAEAPNQKRDDEIQKVMNLTGIIISMLGEEKNLKFTTDIKAGKIDIDLSDELAGVVMTVFTCLRKQKNDPNGHAKYLNYKASIDGTELQIKDIIDKFNESGQVFDFMIATPIVEMMTLFRSFFDEVRTGVIKFRVRESVMKRGIKRDQQGNIVGRSDPKQNSQNISQYGLTNQHIPLLQGITLAPERRTGIVRSLGPLTQCILLSMEDKYYERLAHTVSQSLMMLPMAGEIAQCLKESNSPGKTAGVLKELGDILLITTARTTQKIYLPLTAIAYMWTNKGARSWSFSGAEMIKYYSELVIEKKMTFYMKSGGTETKTGEAIFHAIFGTYLEDLTILEKITNHSAQWGTRKDLNSVFLKRSEKRRVKAKMIGFVLVAKMAQAMQTKAMGNVDPCYTSRPSFSGFRKRHFSQDLLTYFTTGKGTQNYSTDPLQLQYALKKVKDELLENINDVKVLRSGTVNWQRKEMAEWVASEDVPEEGSRKFF